MGIVGPAGPAAADAVSPGISTLERAPIGAAGGLGATSVTFLGKFLDQDYRRIFAGVFGLLSAGAALLTAGIHANLITPQAFRLDVFFPTTEPEIIEDLVTVRMAFYRDPEKRADPVEQYTDDRDGQRYDIYNKASYLEHVTLRNTNADYAVELTSSGLLPQIIPLLPIDRVSEHGDKTTNGRGYTFVMHPKNRLELSTTPSLKMMYIFRNGFSAGHSVFGKNVKYKTDRFSAILDFTQISNFEQLITDPPQACVKKVGQESLEILQPKWSSGVAFVDVPELERGDRVRVFWNWRDSPRDKKLECGDTMQ